MLSNEKWDSTWRDSIHMRSSYPKTEIALIHMMTKSLNTAESWYKFNSRKLCSQVKSQAVSANPLGTTCSAEKNRECNRNTEQD